jgi:hypothetical protein
MMEIIKREIACKIQKRGENHDELSDNSSKTSMTRKADLENSLLFSLFSGNLTLPARREFCREFIEKPDPAALR